MYDVIIVRDGEQSRTRLTTLLEVEDFIHSYVKFGNFETLDINIGKVALGG